MPAKYYPKRWEVEATPQDEQDAGRLSTKSSEWRRRVQKDLYLDNLDKPEHTLQYGGLNGNATVRGVPLTDDGRVSPQTVRGLHSEPVAVVMRDAVTIETAIRLTGMARETLARAVFAGRVPALKTGPGTAPYLVRMRDVITYLITMWSERRARKESSADGKYLGFPEWLAREVSEGWPEDQPYKPGRWEATEIKINRGGRPRGYSPGKGVSVHGKPLGRPKKVVPGAQPGTENPGSETTTPPEGSHPPAAAAAVPASVDPTTLPKWHPLWRRPEA